MPKLTYLIGAALVLTIAGWILFRTRRLNDNPLQRELAALIVELMDSGPDEASITLFWVSVEARFMRAFITDDGAKQTRLAHALTIARPVLDVDRYRIAQAIIRAA